MTEVARTYIITGECSCGGMFAKLASKDDPARCPRCGMADRNEKARAKLEERTKPATIRTLDAQGPWTEKD